MSYMDAQCEDVRQFDVLTERRVLAVGGSPVFWDYCRSALADALVSTRLAETYEAGLCALENESFDVVLVEQGGWEFEGRCVLERALALDDAPVLIVISGCPDFQCLLQAVELGAADYVDESKGIARLQQAVADALRTCVSV